MNRCRSGRVQRATGHGRAAHAHGLGDTPESHVQPVAPSTVMSIISASAPDVEDAGADAHAEQRRQQQPLEAQQGDDAEQEEAGSRPRRSRTASASCEGYSQQCSKHSHDDHAEEDAAAPDRLVARGFLDAGAEYLGAEHFDEALLQEQGKDRAGDEGKEQRACG
jgi:hypothetical protein